MRTIFLGGAAAAILLATVNASPADTINFGQFGSGLFLPNSIDGTTLDGVSFTIIGPGNGFRQVTAGSTAPLRQWSPTQFATGDAVLFDLLTPGPVTIDFATAISSISSFAAEPDNLGPYTATLTAYDGVTLLGVSSYFDSGTPGTIPSFSFSAPAITSIVISTTDDTRGFALGPAGSVTPLPSSWTMMLGGLVLLGFIAHQKSRDLRNLARGLREESLLSI
jgi:hypothetical protein